MAFSRDDFGPKTKVGSNIRAELLELIKARSGQTGASMTRIIEDALILYFHFIYNISDDYSVEERLMDLPIQDVCNDVGDILCEWVTTLEK